MPRPHPRPHPQSHPQPHPPVHEPCHPLRAQPPPPSAQDLNRLTVTDLKIRYAEVFGEATRTNHKHYLIKRILWRMQALREGGLSERARRRALELASDAEIRLSAPRSPAPETDTGAVMTAAFDRGRAANFPLPGAMLRREYKGRVLLVKVLPRGFEYEGEVYRSLTAIAQKVTGAHWNGVSFFGLHRRKGSRAVMSTPSPFAARAQPGALS